MKYQERSLGNTFIVEIRAMFYLATLSLWKSGLCFIFELCQHEISRTVFLLHFRCVLQSPFNLVAVVSVLCKYSQEIFIPRVSHRLLLTDGSNKNECQMLRSWIVGDNNC